MYFISEMTVHYKKMKKKVAFKKTKSDELESMN